MVQECSGARLQLTGPPSGPGSCQDEENALNARHTVTGADVVVRVHHSFHFLHFLRYTIDSLAG